MQEFFILNTLPVQLHNMKKIRSLIVVCSLCVYANIYAGVSMQFPFAGSTVELLDSAGAAVVNAQSDVYTRALTPFDLQLRLGQATGATEKDYLERAAIQVRDWPKEEQGKLKQAFGEIEIFLREKQIKLSLPATIQLIKTAGKEEFGAEGYTRANRIILCTGPHQEISSHLVAHELFHVYSRFNEQKRDNIYAIFGFKKCNRINTAAAMNGMVITNPDCPFTEHYITLETKGKPMDMVLQLYSRKAYREDYTLGDYANVGLLQVEGGDKDKKPVLKGGNGMVYSLEAIPDLFRQISTNTSYVLHPEEISAEHFAMWVVKQEVAQPGYFDRLEKVLKQ